MLLLLLPLQDTKDEKKASIAEELASASQLKEAASDMEYKDEGYIEMVLKLLALMCDGQFHEIQVGLHLLK